MIHKNLSPICPDVLIQYLQWYDGTEKDYAVSGFAKGVTGF